MPTYKLQDSFTSANTNSILLFNEILCTDSLDLGTPCETMLLSIRTETSQS